MKNNIRKLLDKKEKPEQLMVYLMVQYLHAYGPRLLGGQILDALIKYKNELEDENDSMMQQVSHVCFGMFGEAYEKDIR